MNFTSLNDVIISTTEMRNSGSAIHVVNAHLDISELTVAGHNVLFEHGGISMDGWRRSQLARFVTLDERPYFRRCLLQ